MTDKEFEDYIALLSKHWPDVKTFAVNSDAETVEIKWGWKAKNMGGFQDQALPLKRGKSAEARGLVERMRIQISNRWEVPVGDCRALHSLLAKPKK